MDQQLEEQAKRRALVALFLVKRDLRQNWRLDYVFGFFGFFVRIHQLAAGIDQARGYEDNLVAFDVLLYVGAEKRRLGPSFL